MLAVPTCVVVIGCDVLLQAVVDFTLYLVSYLDPANSGRNER